IALLAVGCSTPAPAPAPAPAPGPAPAPAPAPAWIPEQPITIYSHYGVGSSYDMYPRGLSPIVSKYLGQGYQHVIADVKPGSDGVLGTTYVFNAKPDGYTLGCIDMAKMVTYNMVRDVPFNYEEFTYITAPALGHFVLAVAADSPINSIDDLRAAGEINPIRVVCGSAGRNELIPFAALDIKHTFVTGYRGGPTLVGGILKGEGDVLTVGDTMLMPFFLSGDMKPIMSYGTERNPLLLKNGFDIPCSAELGAHELDNLVSIIAIVAPPGTPPEIASVLESAFMKAYQDPEGITWAEEANLPIAEAMNGAEAREAMNMIWDLFYPWRDLLDQHMAK
ncbi:Bug family tripartite tricarboxylate transporter substrate binding protein, partial [Chloroflexota bacterium]